MSYKSAHLARQNLWLKINRLLIVIMKYYFYNQKEFGRGMPSSKSLTLPYPVIRRRAEIRFGWAYSVEKLCLF